MVRNMCRSYLTNQEGGKVPTQIMVTWRITDRIEPHLELVTAAASVRWLNTRAELRLLRA